jgi:hypothetical protein
MLTLPCFDGGHLVLIKVRHVALLRIQGKEFEMTPIPLRTVRPFVLEEVVLLEAAEEEGFEAGDQMEVSKFLKSRVCGFSILLKFLKMANKFVT